MPNPTISIITSVYNAKDYLPRTVASILAQTFTDFELLLVEDGSPNGCGELCDELAKTDPRIRVFHKPNGGPASASNMGLDNARGDYVGFVDSDDLIEPTMYETLLNAIRDSGAAIAACAGDAIDEQDAPIPGQTVVLRQYGKIDAMALILETFQTGSFYGPLSWNKLFDIRLFRERKIHYDETMLFGDDASVLHLVFEGQQAICLPDTLYHYRTRRGSITAAAFPPRKLDDLRMYWDWLQYFAAQPQRQDYYRWAQVWYWRTFYQFWVLAGEAGNQKELKEGFFAHKKHLDSLLPDLLRSGQLSAGEKLRAVLFCISPTLTYGAARCWGRLCEHRKG